MAQLVLTLAGSAVGGLIGGGFGQGLGAMVGAYVGGILEQEIFAPRDVVRNEGSRIAEFQISGSAYGQSIPLVFGRGRLAANIIWMRGIREERVTETVGGGGKGGSGGGQTVETVSYNYYTDVALGLCRGPVTSIYRIWVDKRPLDPEHVGEIRLHYGGEDQDPDPLIQAVEGADRTPAFRGLAYVVLENLWLNPYASRLPIFEIEVFRSSLAGSGDARHRIEGICLIRASGGPGLQGPVLPVPDDGHAAAKSDAVSLARADQRERGRRRELLHSRRRLPALRAALPRPL